MVSRRVAALAATLVFLGDGPAAAVGADDSEARQSRQTPFVLLAASRRTCKQVSSCYEAVVLWCSGYTRADGDGDGIPCENVCHSLKEVNRIRDEIGC